MKTGTVHRFFAATAALLAALTVLPASAEPPRAVAVVESQSVFAGEPFAFQIRVAGSDSPREPDLSPLEESFHVAFQGGRQNNSQSVTIVNGKMTREVRRNYVFSYRLTAREAGRSAIPSILVETPAGPARTEAVDITVRAPETGGQFKLRQELSRPRAYVGEPVILTVTWYLNRDVRNVRFRLPVMESGQFHVVAPEVDTRAGKGQYYRLPLNDGDVIGEKGAGDLGGQRYTTLAFRKVLIPREAGRLTIEAATVASDYLTGYRRRKPFGGGISDFFNDDFFGRGQGVYRRSVAASNTLTLDVASLPADGRPPGFAGHVGPYRLQAAADPTAVRVGDPITLRVTLSGPPYIEHVSLPPLAEQGALARNFKIPAERAGGEVTAAGKVFTQTIRVRRADVSAIPAIELPYFDTDAGAYRVARSRPIPLEVEAARVVTAADAEGGAAPRSVEAARVETWTRGIAHNYEDLGVIQPRRLRPSDWLGAPPLAALTVAGPLTWLLVLAAVTLYRRRHADPAALRARTAHARAGKALARAADAMDPADAPTRVLEALRGYLGDRLGRRKGALVFEDVCPELRRRGAGEQTLAGLEKLFARCEAGRYAGEGSGGDGTRLAAQARECLARLEGELK